MFHLLDYAPITHISIYTSPTVGLEASFSLHVSRKSTLKEKVNSTTTWKCVCAVAYVIPKRMQKRKKKKKFGGKIRSEPSQISENELEQLDLETWIFFLFLLLSWFGFTFRARDSGKNVVPPNENAPYIYPLCVYVCVCVFIVNIYTDHMGTHGIVEFASHD